MALRAVEARGRGAGAAQPGARRPLHSHRPAPVVLRALPTRPPDAVLRGDPARALPVRRRRDASGDRWCTPATSSTPCCSPKWCPRPTGARTGSPTPSRTRCATCCRPCATRSAAEGIPASSRRSARSRGSPRRPPRTSTALLQGTGRYVQAVHVLGELKDTIACDITRARERARLRAGSRLARGDARQHPVVPGTGRGALMARSVLITGGSGYFGTVLAERAVAAGDAVRVFDVNPPAADGPPVEYVAG